MPVMKVPATDLRSAAPSVFHEVFRIVFHGMRYAYSTTCRLMSRRSWRHCGR